MRVRIPPGAPIHILNGEYTMIDTRDYPSRDELNRAMRLEHYISELRVIDTNLATLECSFNFCKSQYESQIEMLNSRKRMLESSISALEKTYIHDQSKKKENDSKA